MGQGQGYRATLTPRLTVDLAAYHNRYGDLRTSEPGFPQAHPDLEGYLLIPLLADNRQRATAWGAEVALRADLSRRLRLRAGVARSRIRTRLEAGSRLEDNDGEGRSNPQNVGFVHLSCDPRPTLQVDAIARGVGALPARGVAAYADLDAHVAWRPRPAWRLGLVARNLLARDRLEWGETTSILRATAVSPSVRLCLEHEL